MAKHPIAPAPSHLLKSKVFLASQVNPPVILCPVHFARSIAGRPEALAAWLFLNLVLAESDPHTN